MSVPEGQAWQFGVKEATLIVCMLVLRMHARQSRENMTEACTHIYGLFLRFAPYWLSAMLTRIA